MNGMVILAFCVYFGVTVGGKISGTIVCAIVCFIVGVFCLISAKTPPPFLTLYRPLPDLELSWLSQLSASRQPTCASELTSQLADMLKMGPNKR